MSPVTRQITELIDMLPETEQALAYEFVKRLVLAWDSDFTKLTPDERKKLESALTEIQKGETISHDALDWN